MTLPCLPRSSTSVSQQLALAELANQEPSFAELDEFEILLLYILVDR